MYKHPCLLILTFIFLLQTSCKSDKDDKNTAEENQLVLIKKDTSLPENSATKRPPIINLIDTVAEKYLVLYVKDSANTSQRMSEKLQELFTGKLLAFISNEKLEISGPPIVWYKTVKSPFYFEAGFPVNNKPATKSKIYLVKSIGGDSAVVAHYYGPYSKTNMAYDALRDWAAENHQKKNGVPYEIYVSDPWNISGKPDPYKMQTDIVFPHK